jgi:HEAT repeat protein
LLSHAEDETVLPMQNGKLDSAAAMERARRGDPDELLHITRMVAKQPNLLPPRKSLNQYHQYLLDENIFIQYFAVQMLCGLKDKSSAEPLRQFVLDTERRRGDADALGEKERVAMELASATALAALDEIDEGSSVAIGFLASQLKHDRPMEWGGGVAHSALAKKGRAGLRALLDEAAQPLDDNQKAFLRPAIISIKDPDLAVDLYACCKDRRYHEVARKAALWSLGEMAKQSPDIEQMVINIAEDEKSDLRSMAIGRLGYVGSSRARNTLLKFEKTLPQEARAVQAALLACDTTDSLPGVVEAFLSPKTLPDEKSRLWGLLEGKTNAELHPYEKQLRDCLTVSDETGVPINHLRAGVWARLFSLTKNHYPVELDFSDEQCFQRVATRIIDCLRSELDDRYSGTGKYSYAQLKEMALEEAKTFITKWGGQKKEVKQ